MSTEYKSSTTGTVSRRSHNASPREPCCHYRLWAKGITFWGLGLVALIGTPRGTSL